jgi:cell division protein ZapE
MKPSSKYNEFLQQSGFHQDTAQQHAIHLLDQLQAQLQVVEQGFAHKLHSFLARLGGKTVEPVRGLYFWGGVGRGKTFLMDIFYQTLPIKDKKRVHFHKFMKQIHDQLTLAKKGLDPLRKIASDVTEGSKVLCLDEFVVTDIGDAMLIGRLLSILFEQGTVLVTTSNSPPHELYKDGLQRANFLPAIDLIEQYCQICNLDGGQDYRMLGLSDTELYHYPHDDDAVSRINDYIRIHLVAGERNQSIEINDRPIRFEYCAEDTIWFTFQELCKSSRSRLDYLEIAQMYGTVILTQIEQMDNRSNDAARRFISLIDVLYDHKVNMICTAEVAHNELYVAGPLAFEFQRTSSRLQEMQSTGYMHQSHQI